MTLWEFCTLSKLRSTQLLKNYEAACGAAGLIDMFVNVFMYFISVLICFLGKSRITDNRMKWLQLELQKQQIPAQPSHHHLRPSAVAFTWASNPPG